MALFVERPVDEAIFAPCWVSLDVRGCTQIIGDESAQMIGIVSGVHDDVLRFRQPFDEPKRLRAITPLTGRDDSSNWQAKGIDCGMDLCGQAAFRATNTGSFKPPF